MTTRQALIRIERTLIDIRKLQNGVRGMRRTIDVTAIACLMIHLGDAERALEKAKTDIEHTRRLKEFDAEYAKLR